MKDSFPRMQNPISKEMIAYIQFVNGESNFIVIHASAQSAMLNYYVKNVNYS